MLIWYLSWKSRRLRDQYTNDSGISECDLSEIEEIEYARSLTDATQKAQKLFAINDVIGVVHIFHDDHYV